MIKNDKKIIKNVKILKKIIKNVIRKNVFFSKGTFRDIYQRLSVIKNMKIFKNLGQKKNYTHTSKKMCVCNFFF